LKNIKFSIIICAFNMQEYIDKTINSVLNQTYKNYEIIVVNDKSTDKTLEILEKYKNNIIIINNEKNLGLGGSRNIACKHAKGEYIIYLDADDTLYENTTLEKIKEVLEKNYPDIAYFGVKYIGGSNKTYIPTAENSTKEARILCDMHFAVSSKCWKREFLEKNNITFIEGIYYEDMVYSIKGVILAEKIGYGEFPIYNYLRNRKGSITTDGSIKKCSDMYIMLSHLLSLYDITQDEYKPYLLSFIKNETMNLPRKINGILKAMKNNENCPIFEKRHYIFDKDDEDINI